MNACGPETLISLMWTNSKILNNPFHLWLKTASCTTIIGTCIECVEHIHWQISKFKTWQSIYTLHFSRYLFVATTFSRRKFNIWIKEKTKSAIFVTNEFPNYLQSRLGKHLWTPPGPPSCQFLIYLNHEYTKNHEYIKIMSPKYILSQSLSKIRRDWKN